MSQPSWKVFDEVLTRGDATSLAVMLHVSKATITNWTMPSAHEGGGGQPTPFDRVVTIIRTLRANGNPESERLIRWLNEELGYVAPARRITPDELTHGHVGHMCGEFGDVLTAHSEETEPRRVTLAGVRRIRKEIAESVAAHLSVDHAWKLFEEQLECGAEGEPPAARPMPIRNRGGAQ